jgi:hypothetical protein
MMDLNLEELLDTFEQHYQYKHVTGDLVDIRALTAQDGEVYIEYKFKGKQFNQWVSLNHANIYKRIANVEILEQEEIQQFVEESIYTPQSENTSWKW